MCLYLKYNDFGDLKFKINTIHGVFQHESGC